MTATYLDGHAANVEAAAADSLDWLRLFRTGYSMNDAGEENRKRLDYAIRALERLLPTDEAVFDVTGEKFT